MKDTPTDLVTLAVLARRLRLSAAWLRSETQARRLPHLQAGHRTLFNVAAVKQALLHRAAIEGVVVDYVPSLPSTAPPPLGVRGDKSARQHAAYPTALYCGCDPAAGACPCQ